MKMQIVTETTDRTVTADDLIQKFQTDPETTLQDLLNDRSYFFVCGLDNLSIYLKSKFSHLSSDHDVWQKLNNATIEWLRNRRGTVPVDFAKRDQLSRSIDVVLRIVDLLQLQQAKRWINAYQTDLLNWTGKLALSPARDPRNILQKVLGTPFMEDEMSKEVNFEQVATQKFWIVKYNLKGLDKPRRVYYHSGANNWAIKSGEFAIDADEDGNPVPIYNYNMTCMVFTSKKQAKDAHAMLERYRQHVVNHI